MPQSRLKTCDTSQKPLNTTKAQTSLLAEPFSSLRLLPARRLGSAAVHRRRSGTPPPSLDDASLPEPIRSLSCSRSAGSSGPARSSPYIDSLPGTRATCAPPARKPEVDESYGTSMMPWALNLQEAPTKHIAATNQQIPHLTSLSWPLARSSNRNDVQCTSEPECSRPNAFPQLRSAGHRTCPR